MAGILVLIALLLSVGIILWRYETLGDTCFEEGRVLEGWTAPKYDPFVYSPLIHPRCSFWSPQPLEGKKKLFLRIKFEELGIINIEVNQQTFEEAERGKLVVVMYQIGRLTRQLRAINLC